jgi:hypothetical protein
MSLQVQQALAWWSGLSDAWKKAFNEAALKRSSIDDLPEEMLLTVFTSPNHRFAGPTAPYPNVSFELTDLSGLEGLPNAEIVVVVHHSLIHIREVAEMKKLSSLFVYNNRIQSLQGLENLTGLKELFVQCNEVDSLTPLQKLTNLQTVYCSYNLIGTLEGIGEQHADKLENFYCLPNPNIKDAVAMRFEREVGIRCKKG